MPRSEARRSTLQDHPRAWRLALALFLIVVVLTASGIIGAHFYTASHQTLVRTPTPTPTSIPTAPPVVQGQPIIHENALPGTTDWLIPDPAYPTQIQAYASATSVSPGQHLTFYVSTQSSHTPYTVQIFRLGWYGGAGGRLMMVTRLIGQAQGYYNPLTKKLVGCSSCLIDPFTHLIEANWKPSFSITIPDTWVTGLYEAKIGDDQGRHTAVSFEVKGNLQAAYVVVIADNTTAAYNDWGGYSLYHGPDGSAKTRAYKVSFDRPAPGWYYGQGNGLPYDIDAIRWMECQGYDLSYISSVDLDEHPEQLLNHKAFISLGHDEYWSRSMRSGVENARNHGVGLAFFGANDMYWQIRYERDSHGVADRTVVCYRYTYLDPLYGKDNALVTVRWRNSPLNSPENAVIGIMYGSDVVPPHAFPWRVSPIASSSLLKGTGLQRGFSYGCDLVGYEWDSVSNNGAAPRGLTILGTSPVISKLGLKGSSATAYYIAASGALVFASGSIYWAYALDDLRVWDIQNAAQTVSTNSCLSHSHAIPGIQTLMEHVMSQLIINHHHAEALHLPQNRQERLLAR